jgi:hypothetical protein
MHFARPSGDPARVRDSADAYGDREKHDLSPCVVERADRMIAGKTGLLRRRRPVGRTSRPASASMLAMHNQDRYDMRDVRTPARRGPAYRARG